MTRTEVFGYSGVLKTPDEFNCSEDDYAAEFDFLLRDAEAGMREGYGRLVEANYNLGRAIQERNDALYSIESYEERLKHSNFADLLKVAAYQYSSEGMTDCVKKAIAAVRKIVFDDTDEACRRFRCYDITYSFFSRGMDAVSLTFGRDDVLDALDGDPEADSKAYANDAAMKHNLFSVIFVFPWDSYEETRRMLQEELVKSGIYLKLGGADSSLGSHNPILDSETIKKRVTAFCHSLDAFDLDPNIKSIMTSDYSTYVEYGRGHSVNMTHVDGANHIPYSGYNMINWSKVLYDP